MNYQRIHDAIIERASNRTLLGYREKHHVIPRCMGGVDTANNLVELTAREHFIIHKLRVLWQGTTRSIEDRQKISAGQLDKKRKIVICPHCGKTGGNNGMAQWHFEKCKFKS
jgi:hypothetical protein